MPTCPTCGSLVPADTLSCARCGPPIRRAPPTPTFAGQPGATVASGRYTLEAHLGTGGMGSVYRARDNTLGRQVALKVLNPELISHPTARARMLREAGALARIEHPNVLRIHDVFEEGPQLLLVLELVTDGTLGDRMTPGGLPEVEALRWLDGMLAGLEALHAQGLVHRDVKPANVLVNAKGMPKLADLGVAHDTAGRGMTKAGAQLGTAEYMSPEQIRGLEVDARTDLYACGIVLYELLTGEVPFSAPSEFDVKAAHVSTRPDLRRLRTTTTAATCDAIAKALEKAPGDRFASASEMRAALQAAAVDDLRPVVKYGGPPEDAVPPAETPGNLGGAAPRDARFRSGGTPPYKPAAGPSSAPRAAAAPPAARLSPWLAFTLGFIALAAIAAAVLGLIAFGVKTAIDSDNPATDHSLAGLAQPPSTPAEPAPPPPPDNLASAKALIDRMTGELEKMIVEVEASGGDEAKVKAVGDKFKASADTMKVEGEALSKLLTEDEKKAVEAYGREKMTPLMGRLMGAMMKNRPVAK